MPQENVQPMGPDRRDSLLTLVWWLLTFLLALCLFVGLFCLLAYPVMLLNKDYFVAEFARSGISASAFPWIGVLGILGAAEFALSFLFLRHLRRMIDSVVDGHPFESMNAERLRRMAWLSIATQIVAVPLSRLVIWFDAMPQAPNVHHGNDGISIGSILLTLVLFVLARVFRTGAEMEQDLEGTV